MRARDLLGARERAWLRDALILVYPDYPWIEKLT